MYEALLSMNQILFKVMLASFFFSPLSDCEGSLCFPSPIIITLLKYCFTTGPQREYDIEAKIQQVMSMGFDEVGVLSS